jgi:hypothetical protein
MRNARGRDGGIRKKLAAGIRPFIDCRIHLDCHRTHSSESDHDGSLWAALEPNKGMKPGPSASWKLCVKRGRDGRDAPAPRVTV